MEIKSYIEPQEILEFIIKKSREIHGELLLANSFVDGPMPSLSELPDATFEAGKTQGRIEASAEIISQLIKLVKK